jgi:predicted nuclease of predicted toxin-antitoxin system
MKLLLNQDIYATTARFLIDSGYDIVLAAQLGLARADDEVLLRVAHEQARIFLTRDRDFGNLMFVKDFGAGVLYLRMSPSTQNAVHHQLEKVLTTYSSRELAKVFVVIEPDGYRIRRLPRS